MTNTYSTSDISALVIFIFFKFKMSVNRPQEMFLTNDIQNIEIRVRFLTDSMP